MSWDALPPEVRDVAEEVCTDAELDALRLYAGTDPAGKPLGYSRVARRLGISRSAARERIENASRKIRARMEDASTT